MNFDIFTQYLLLLVGGIVVGIFVFLGTSITFKHKLSAVSDHHKETHKKVKRLYFNQKLLLILVASLLLSAIITAILSHATGSEIPSNVLLMFVPTFLSILWLIVFWRNMPKLSFKLIGVFAIISSILFSSILINDYYRYFPTLGSVFGKNTAIALGSQPPQVLLQYTPAADGQSLLNTNSVEYAFTSVPSQPTAGKLYKIDIPGTVSHFHARSGYVYVPAIYSNPTGVFMPVLVLTAGFPGTPDNWVALGLQSMMDGFAKHHDGITPLVVVADNTGSLGNDTECVDSSRGNVETYLTVDVPNYINSHFVTEAGPSHWAIGGMSMGGTCAVMLALRHPNVYHYFLDFGGEVGPEVGSQSATVANLFNGSLTDYQQHQPLYLLQNKTYQNMGGFFAVGSEDERKVVDGTNQLTNATKNAGIETISETVNGQHTFDVWGQSFKQSLAWVSNRIGATQCQASCY